MIGYGNRRAHLEPGTLNKMQINKRWTGHWVVEHNGEIIGSISSDQPGYGIKGNSNNVYTACIKPSPNADGFSHSGTLNSCKKFINDWAKLLELN